MKAKILFSVMSVSILTVFFQNCGQNSFEARMASSTEQDTFQARFPSSIEQDTNEPLDLSGIQGAALISGKIYYVATNGSDNNGGTSTKPWRTISYAVSKMVAGDTTYVRGGLYNEKLVAFRKSGTASARIKLLNYPGEKPIVDFGVTATNVVANRFEIAKLVGYITIEGLEIRRGYNGIKLNSANNNITIRRNWIRNSRTSGILGSGTNIIIDRNVINHNGTSDRFDHGMYLSGSSYVISNNLIYANKTYGFQVAGISNSQIANNTFAYNNASGIVLWQAGTHTNKVINNIFYENTAGPNRTSASVNGVAFLNSGKGNAINNNLFFASGYGGMRAVSSNTNAIEGVHYTLSKNIVNTHNPKFVSAPATLPSSPNFMLTSSSPAINKGLTTTATKLDFRGVARPRGSAYDIGAYEY